MRLSGLTFDRAGLSAALECTDPAFNEALRQAAYQTKLAHVGPDVYLRGLIEISNRCRKDCLYCGIRRGNAACPRYELSDEEVLTAASFAAEHRYASVVIQGGERSDPAFIRKITRLVRSIKALETASDGGRPLGITLSLGEQPREVYQEWFDAGAHRYLLRIESSNPDLYRKIHPQDPLHGYDRRLKALDDLKAVGFQAGTGAMIGLPYQTADDMAADLLFYKQFDAPMVGMGPYNPNGQTPLTLSGAAFPPDRERLALGLKMIALLRLLMPDINIAAATSLEVLSPRGRELGLLSGANIIMPNVTPVEQMVKYNLYERKALLRDRRLDDVLQNGSIRIGFGQWGDSRHFQKR